MLTHAYTGKYKCECATKICSYLTVAGVDLCICIGIQCNLAEFEPEPFSFDIVNRPRPVYSSNPTKCDTTASSVHDEENTSMYDPANDVSLSLSTIQRDNSLLASTLEHQKEYFMVARECLWELLIHCPSCS